MGEKLHVDTIEYLGGEYALADSSPNSNCS